MALVGLAKRHNNCKICLSFPEDNILNELTLDVIYNRIPKKDICEKYNKLLPIVEPPVPPINELNLLHHLNHADPKLFYEDILRDKDKPITQGEHAAVLFAERFQGTIDKHLTLHALYKSRINTIQFLRELLSDKENDYNTLRNTFFGLTDKDTSYNTIKSKMKMVESEIRGLIKQIDSIEEGLQQVILRDMSVERGPGNTFINNNILNIESSLKGFMGEIIPYFLYDVFSNDIEMGKKVVGKMSVLMDKYLSGSLKQIDNVRQN